MAGKCCKPDENCTSSGGCPVMKKEGCCKKKSSSGCAIADFLGVPKCVIMTAGAIALIGVSAAVTMNYMKRK